MRRTAHRHRRLLRLGVAEDTLREALHPYPEHLLIATKIGQVPFAPWFPVMNGGLTQPDGVPAEIAAETGSTPTQVALAWLLARAHVVCPIPGTSSLAHLEENVAAATLRLTDDQVARLTATAHPAAAADTRHRGTRTRFSRLSRRLRRPLPYSARRSLLSHGHPSRLPNLHHSSGHDPPRMKGILS